jgi:hypothetical protein
MASEAQTIPSNNQPPEASSVEVFFRSVMMGLRPTKVHEEPQQ